MSAIKQSQKSVDAWNLMEMNSEALPSVLADRPYFASPERIDDARSITSATFAGGELSVGQYRRDRPDFGLTDANPIVPVFMAVVFLRPFPGHQGWRNGKPIDIPNRRLGSLSCVDFRESWISDVLDPFHTFNAFIPKQALDEFNAELKLPKFERLNCPIEIETQDETMLGVAHALGPLMAKPKEATSLFIDHIFSAMVAHLATTYGGMKSGGIQTFKSRHQGALTPLQERRVTGLLLDDLKGDHGLPELASSCGLSRSYFVRAFKQTTGLPPHRWLLKQRITRAKELLYKTGIPIREIAEDCGFADQGHLTRVFTKAFGIGPGAWRRHRQN